jgi:hypothetical protein
VLCERTFGATFLSLSYQIKANIPMVTNFDWKCDFVRPRCQFAAANVGSHHLRKWGLWWRTKEAYCKMGAL